jgi:UvrD-like helicase family protein
MKEDGLPKNVAFGYASTIHKAQGSEFEHVIVVVDGANDWLLRKQSFYTAVTRARSSLSIIGDLDAAEAMSRSPDRRTTVLQALLGIEAPKHNSTIVRIDADASDARRGRIDDAVPFDDEDGITPPDPELLAAFEAMRASIAIKHWENHLHPSGNTVSS